MNALKLLLRRQRKLGESIDGAKGKFLKTSAANRTEKYFQKRLKEMQQWWSEFSENHKAVLATEGTGNEKESYVAEKYFDEIKQCKDAAVKLYKEFTEIKFPKAVFADVDKEKTVNDGDAEDENEDDDEIHDLEDDELDFDNANVSMNSTKLFKAFNEVQKRKSVENLYAVRATTLHEFSERLVTKHDEFSPEIELEFDIGKLKNMHHQYLAALEERIMIAKDEYEVEGVRIESEDLINVAERVLFSLMARQAECKRKKNSAPDAPKLQPLKVPKFNGNFQNWIPFLNLFTKVVHDNEKLNNVQRMQYLFDCLEGEPRRLIQHLELTDKNYDSAIGLLKRRYNDERKIICKHLDDVIDHPSIGDDVRGLKSIVDICTESLHALKNQGISEKRLGEVLLLRIIEKKLDVHTRRFFETSLVEKRKMPELVALMDFLEDRFIGMENIVPDGDVKSQKNVVGNRGSFNGNKRSGCSICNEQHRIHQCPKYNGMSPYDRSEAIKKAKLCRNCLGAHETNKCNSAGNCGKCSKFHHISLHFESRIREKGERFEKNDRDNAQAHVAKNERSEYDVLLATAVIMARNEDGKYIELRALIDQGSTTSFISEDAAQRLRVKRHKNSTTVTGIGATEAAKSQGSATISMKPRYPSSTELSVEALILKKLTTFSPGDLAERKWEHTDGLVLADPGYNRSGKIDIILGADVFGVIVLGGVIRGPPNTPIAQETELGWILSGRWNRSRKWTKAVGLVSNAHIEDRLETFWRIEDVPEISDARMTEDERRCEEFYQRTFRRTENGQYVTRLPFKTSDFCMGKSRNIAVATMMQMEKKFRRNPSLKAEYAKCINEYLELGHMELAHTSDESLVEYRDGKKHYNCYYLPHHAIVKESSTTTKLRVVFNASQKTNSGISLNDVMMIGPTVQDDLLDILLRWRKHRFAVTADIEKMYRQFIVDDADVDYQRIVWRTSEDEPIRDYRIKRVFFGNASAPFVAIRTVKQLARDEHTRFPKAAAAAESDFYVDDLITGSHTIGEAEELQHQLRGLMQTGCLNLRKWATNAPDCLKGIPEEHREIKGEIEISGMTIKMLGVQWDPRDDKFMYHVNLGEEKSQYTKRKIVSEVAQLFDPLGWLAPVVVLAKIQLQELWLAGLDWDASVSQHIDDKWRNFRRTLTRLNDISIQRYVGLGFETARYELHGFCDASTKAYAAAVYLRCLFENGEVQVNLLVAKSRVAPTKTISIPRLELCGALLLSNLLVKVNSALKMKLEVHAWTDSMITLAWINGNLHRWETFVANRVSKIRDMVECEKWHHVGTKDNPADVASRGMDAADLKGCDIWWNGPIWLSKTELKIGQLEVAETTEGVKRSHALIAKCDSEYQDVIRRFSNYDKLGRVLAYCQRFVFNCRARGTDRRFGPVLVSEMRASNDALIKWAQRFDFQEEIQLLEDHKEVSTKSSIISLSPFLSEGILRVRGRIQSDNMPYARKHPIILAYSNPLTSLIIEDAHKKTLHGGNQLTLAFIRQRFWILKAKRAVKTVLRKCVTCFKYRAQTREQQMGNLPRERTTESRPFSHTGVDFCGPFDIKNKTGRGSRTSKGYVAIFVCLATKAIHIEVVSDLTSEAFIAAFRRMVGRRGAVAHLFSDNGTNFVGANKIIQAENRAFKKEYNDEVAIELTRMGTEWHFIPPSAPHFGGLWEAGVKSIKHHFKRVIGDVKLTYEEMSTVLCQIEACLNSRPLYPISEDPGDLRVLTPGHFLIGESPTLPMETDYHLRPMNGLKRWQLCSKLQQDFWRVWKDEYLSRLQQRTKWLKKSSNIRVGDMVLAKDERTPSSAWPLGRIVETHCGRDDLVRVVDVRIGRKTFRRPITKICVLPIEDNESSNAGGRDDDVESSSRNISTASMSSSLLTILIVFLGLVAAAAGNPTFSVHKFRNDSIAYVEKLGEAQIVNGDWNLVVYYDLKNYFDEYKWIREGLARFEKQCQELDFNCTPLIVQFSHRLQRIEELNELLKNEHGGARARRQAVVALALGGMAVYSWLSKNEANEYAQMIENLKINQVHMMELLRNQTSVMELTDQVIKRTLRQMEKEHDALRDDISQLAGMGERAELGWQLQNIALQYSIMLENYADVQGRIIDAVMTVHRGQLHPVLIPPAKILEQIELIGQGVGPGFELPRTTALIYRMAEVKVRLTQDKLIFRVSIPVLRAAVFRLWRITPIPQPSNGGFVEIQPSAEYFLVNLDNGTYYDMAKMERSACEDIDDRLICKGRHPVYKFGAATGRCEIELIRNVTSNHAACRKQHVSLEERWIQLNGAHSWMFAINGTRNYNVSCDGFNYVTRLTGNGVLHLDGNCSFEGGNMQIFTSRLETKMNSGYAVSANISHNLEHRQATFSVSTAHVNTTDLDVAIDELKRRSSEKLLNISFHDWHQYGLMYGLMVLVGVIYAVRRYNGSRIKHVGFIVRPQPCGRENVRV